MEEASQQSESPLSGDDIELIAATSLPILEQHHLRLLAHCLACFKTMSSTNQQGALPNESVRMEWCLNHPALKDQKPFIPILLEQLSSAGEQLEDIAKELGISCLELSLQDLIEISMTRRNDV